MVAGVKGSASDPDLKTEEMVHLKVSPHPFRRELIEAESEPGRTIEEIIEDLDLGDFGRYLTVQLDGRPINGEMWEHIRPKKDTELVVKAVPQGGDDNKIFRTIALIAVFSLAGSASGFFFDKSASPFLFNTARGAFGVVGAMAVNAVFPPPDPRTFDGAGEGRTGVVPRITGTQNRKNKYGAIPRVYGKHRMYPVLMADPVTEVQGEDQYLRMLLTCGYGPVKMSDFRIGNTPLSEYDEVTTQTREGRPSDQQITLFPDDTNPQNLSVDLTTSYATRTTDTNTDEISLDLSFPRGLSRFKDNGDRVSESVDVTVEYRETGSSGSWTTIHNGGISENKPNRFSKGFHVQVSRGQYDVRVKRSSAESSDSQVLDKVTWTALRSITDQDPVHTDATISKIAIRIKATGQLQGVIKKLNCIVESEMPDWDGSSWVDRTTSNPASIYRQVLQGEENPIPLPDSKVDLTRLQEWHDFCESEGFTYNGIVDQKQNMKQFLKEVATAGRAARHMRNGKRSVIIDQAQSTPKQHFTPHNSRSFKTEKNFRRQVDAMQVRFVNENEDWDEDERIVYADGESEATATEFEDLEFRGVTDPDAIYKLARHHMAQNILRPESFSLITDVEFLTADRGHMVHVAHDVILVGLGSGRVKSVQTNGSGDVTGVTLTDTVEMESGTNYAVRFRLTPSGDSLLENVDTSAGETTSLTFSTPIPSGDPAPSEGDLFQFGEQGKVTEKMIIKEIEPLPELEARLYLTNYDDGIYSASTGSIPSHSPNITTPKDQRPPNIFEVESGRGVMERSVDGSYHPAIRLAISPFAPKQDTGYGESYGSSYGGSPESRITPETRDLEAEFKRSDATIWRSDTSVDVKQNEIYISPVDPGVTYDIRVRAINETGEVTQWSYVFDHTVEGKDEVPNQPSNVTLSQGTGETVDVTWTEPPDPDADRFAVYRNTSNDASTASLIGKIRSDTFIDATVNYQTEYWYWVASVDSSGNESAKVSAGSILVAQISATEVDSISAQVTFEQATAPAHEAGRIWIDTDNGDVFRSDGSSWNFMGSKDALNLTNGPAEAGADVTGNNIANDVQVGGGRNVAESGADQTQEHADDVVFRQPSAPSHKAGRLWRDTSNDVLFRSNGTTWEAIADSVFLFAASGSLDIPAGYTTMQITAAGGGGGGGGGSSNTAGSCGGGGGAAEDISDVFVSVNSGETYDVNVGAGGTAGPADSGNGGDGGDTTVVRQSDSKTVATAEGGPGGQGGLDDGSDSTGGTSPDIFPEYDGENGSQNNGGDGGETIRGGSGAGATSGGESGNDATQPGAGGGGGYRQTTTQGDQPGGKGFRGEVLIRLF